MTFLQKIEEAKKLIEKTILKYPKIAMGVSFGKDSIVLLHLIREVYEDIEVFAVLSNTEFPETIAFKNRLVKDWKLKYHQYDFVNDGQELEHCCRENKVEKFREAVKDLQCWFSAIRKDEGFSRTDFSHVEEKDGLVKVNPILDFTELDVWRYTALYNLPINPVYQLGYRSLSCKRCSTKEIDESESERAGRWRGTIAQGAECGIHTQSLRKKI